MAARSLLAGRRLRQEARAHAHRVGHALDGELHERRVVGRLQARPRGKVQLQQAGAGLRVHRRRLDPEVLERRDQRVDERVVSTDLHQAVADPGRQRRAARVAQPDLVLEGGQDVVVGHRREDAAKHLTRGEFARRPVGPARRGQADAPAGPPAEWVQRVAVGVDHQVGGPGPDPEALVIGDGGVDGIESEQQVGHDRPLRDGRLERRRTERLPAKRAVDVGEPEQDELGAHPAASSAVTAASTSRTTPANRSTISASSSSVAVNAGASTV